MRSFKRGIRILLGGYLLIVAMLYFFQEKLIFLPTKLPQNYSYSFAQPFEELFLDAEDGARLNALHFKQENSKGAILYFHGNAGDLSRWGNIVTYFVDKGFDVIVMDYRSYGKSTGKLSEDALFKDAQLFYNYAIDHYEAGDLIVYGRSLGTGIATKLASENHVKQLILESPYFSLEEIARKRFPFLPVKWLIRYHFKSFEYIQGVRSPIAIFHGTEDQVIPYESGERLYQAIPFKQKQLVTIPAGGHNNLVDFSAYQDGIDKVLEID